MSNRNADMTIIVTGDVAMDWNLARTRRCKRDLSVWSADDVTSTYFEGLAEKNAKAARGYSRDARPDCKQVCIGLVVTPEGLPIA